MGAYLFQRIIEEGHDSRFDSIRTSRKKFGLAFFAQGVWVSLCLMPILAVNAVPAAAFASGIKTTDVLGLSLYLGGIAFEVIADRQKSKWAREKRQKLHDEVFLSRGLWSLRYSLFPFTSGCGLGLTCQQSSSELLWRVDTLGGYRYHLSRCPPFASGSGRSGPGGGFCLAPMLREPGFRHISLAESERRSHERGEV